MKSLFNSLFKKTKPKVFCISMQKTGTTSVGVFFKQLGYNVADWSISHKNNWAYYWENGDFETIFRSKDFIDNQVVEDAPWWAPECYKVLYHRVPTAKFILFTRNSDQWFNSMLNHNDGKTLGNTKRHCKVYRRENDFYSLVNAQELDMYNEKEKDNLLSLEGYDEHYKKIYEIRNNEVVNFFKKRPPESLFNCTLEDPLKWIKLSTFMQIKIKKGLEVHANKSK